MLQIHHIPVNTHAFLYLFKWVLHYSLILGFLLSGYTSVGVENNIDGSERTPGQELENLHSRSFSVIDELSFVILNKLTLRISWHCLYLWH
jgi:hypothetical protein